MHKQPVYDGAPVYTNGVEEDLFKVGFCLPAGPYVTAEAAASPRLRMNYDLRGKAIQYYYDDAGQVTDSIVLEAGSPCFMMSVDLGRWHRLESLEHGTVIFECKDGKFEPIGEEDILKIE